MAHKGNILPSIRQLSNDRFRDASTSTHWRIIHHYNTTPHQLSIIIQLHLFQLVQSVGCRPLVDVWPNWCCDCDLSSAILIPSSSLQIVHWLTAVIRSMLMFNIDDSDLSISCPLFCVVYHWIQSPLKDLHSPLETRRMCCHWSYRTDRIGYRWTKAEDIVEDCENHCTRCQERERNRRSYSIGCNRTESLRDFLSSWWEEMKIGLSHPCEEESLWTSSGSISEWKLFDAHMTHVQIRQLSQRGDSIESSHQLIVPNVEDHCILQSSPRWRQTHPVQWKIEWVAFRKNCWMKHWHIEERHNWTEKLMDPPSDSHWDRLPERDERGDEICSDL